MTFSNEDLTFSWTNLESLESTNVFSTSISSPDWVISHSIHVRAYITYLFNFCCCGVLSVNLGINEPVKCSFYPCSSVHPFQSGKSHKTGTKLSASLPGGS